MSWLSDIARPEIVALAPYSHADWEPGLVRLHANESPWREPGDDSVAGLNRYPEPHPFALEAQLAQRYGVPPECVLASRGSDEAIDLLVRCYCPAGRGAIVQTPPTFGMYRVAAAVQGAAIVSVPLRAAAGFALDSSALLAALTPAVRLVFLCSPNNPTGNQLPRRQLLELARALHGRALLVIDEAYVEFASGPSLAGDLPQYPALALLRTLSKARALAGARCGVLLAQSEVIALLRRIIQPYALPQLCIEAVSRSLADGDAEEQRRIASLRRERERLRATLAGLAGVRRVWPSEANFLLVEFADAANAMARTHAAGLLVRDFSSLPGLDGAIRITVGSREQNDRLLASLT